MAVNEAKLHEFLGKAVGDMGAAMSAVLVTIGEKLGYYKALAANGPMTSAELASKTRTSERMTREWLLNQAAGGYVNYHPKDGTYSMSEEQAFCLSDDASPAFLLGAFDIIASIHRDEPKITDAFRSGKGLPWGAHDACLFCGTERFFAPNYRGNLATNWIPALNGVKSRLADGAQVADVGCGHGASTVIMAQAYPRANFVGFDFHEPSIQCARKRATDAGVKNVRFEVADATRFPAPPGGYDLVACFDCLHDMGDPVGCAAQVKKSLKQDGTWMIVEPNAADRVEDNLNPIGRVFSAASATICVPASMATNGPALGACAGPARLKDTVTKGGFTHFRVATTTPFNLIIEAKP
jgi:2-polyprenyl-3-methyl-5-hydroxy-6-metoxy-1,4-benzoquinol methylase